MGAAICSRTFWIGRPMKFLLISGRHILAENLRFRAALACEVSISSCRFWRGT
jgi:hypothetical protein